MSFSHRSPVICSVVAFALLLSGVMSYGATSSNPQTSLVDTSVVYASKDGSETVQIWKMNVDGSNKKQLTNDQTSEHDWSRPSPDGKSILFMKAAKGVSVNFALESNELWMMDADGSHQRPIIDINKRNQYGWNGMAHPEWSPDSQKIVLVATLPSFSRELFVVDTAGNNVEQITTPVKIDGENASPLDPSWSTTNKIVFVRTWSCFFVCSNHDVFTLDYQTREEKRITHDPNWNFDPYISPDGKTFVWLSFRSSVVMCPCDLMRGNVQGDLNPQPIIADGGANANGTFSSDSKQLLFLKTVGMSQVLHRINLDGTGLTRVVPEQSTQSGIASYASEARTVQIPATQAPMTQVPGSVPPSPPITLPPETTRVPGSVPPGPPITLPPETTRVPVTTRALPVVTTPTQPVKAVVTTPVTQPRKEIRLVRKYSLRDILLKYLRTTKR